MGFGIITSMPTTARIEPVTQTLLVTYSGWITDDDLLRSYDQVRSLPGFDPDGRELVDFSAVEGGEVTSAGVGKLLGRPPLFGQGARRAIVAPTDVAFGMARMFELRRLEECGEIVVFRTRREALEWLGIPDDSPLGEAT